MTTHHPDPTTSPLAAETAASLAERVKRERRLLRAQHDADTALAKAVTRGEQAERRLRRATDRVAAAQAVADERRIALEAAMAAAQAAVAARASAE